MTFKEKPIIVHTTESISKLLVHDGKEQKKCTKAEIAELKKTNHLIYLTRKRGNKASLSEYYEFITKSATELKQATKGKINMYQTGSFAFTAYYLWKLLGTYKDKPIDVQPLTNMELQVISGANKGSTMFSNKGYTGEGYFYDFKSYIPSIMTDVKFLIPIQPPTENTFKKIRQAEWENPDGIRYLKYGFYRCSVTLTGNEMKDRYFRIQPNNWYTSIDIKLARMLGIQMTLIDDGNMNVLLYDRKKCTDGLTAFCNFVQYMYKLKQKNVTGAKDILNCLWGYLSQVKTKVLTNPSDEKMNQIIDNNTILKEWTEGQTVKVRAISENQNPWLRMKNFLLAESRYRLACAIFKHNEHIKQAHTDGFISSKKLDIVTGKNIGDIAYEGYSPKIIIEGVNNIQGKEDLIKKA